MKLFNSLLVVGLQWFTIVTQATNDSFTNTTNVPITTNTPESTITYTTTVDSENGTTSFWDDCDVNWKVDFEGKSGKFKLYPCDNDGFFIKVHLKSIQEYVTDSKGKEKKSKNKVTSIAYKNAKSESHGSSFQSMFNWQDINGNDVNLTGITMDYLFNVDDTDVIFKSTLYLIDETIQISWDNYTVTLEKGSFKFDYYVENWPFEQDDSRLEILVQMETGGTKVNTKNVRKSNKDVGTRGFIWGEDEFEMDAPQLYDHTTFDNVTSSKSVHVDFESKHDDSSVMISFMFDQAGDAQIISYDPWIKTQQPNVNQEKSESPQTTQTQIIDESDGINTGESDVIITSTAAATTSDSTSASTTTDKPSTETPKSDAYKHSTSIIVGTIVSIMTIISFFQ